jgi:thiol:disulfide interchange protein DsbC
MMKMKKWLMAASLGLLALTGAQAAQPASDAALKKLVEQRLGDGAKVDSITKTPYAGLYEVRIGSDILYTDAEAKYLFVGQIVDAKTHENYTKARIDDVSRIKFSDLPLDAALKTVKGNGKRVIAVFEDPNCGYCKRFRQTIAETDNVTVYTFLYNILAEDSATKSRNVWCAPDKAKAWDDWMLNGKAAPAAPANCNAPNEKVLELGKRLRITGTPTIFFTDGTRVPGAIGPKELEAKLASVK